jgi:RNA polymerase sigma-70 factor, ECF subfamily
MKDVLLLFRTAVMYKESPEGTDKDLIAAACKGSEEAFRKLYEKYWQDLYKIAYRRLPSEEDVKDILQETFISLWKNLHHISVNESLGGYLYTSLRNKIFNYYEKNGVRLKTLMNQPFKPAESEDIIYSSLSTKELQLVISAILAEMPPKMREIYKLSKEEQLTNAEIAGLLMLAPQTIKNQIHEALHRIREELKKSSLHLFLFLF